MSVVRGKVTAAKAPLKKAIAAVAPRRAAAVSRGMTAAKAPAGKAAVKSAAKPAPAKVSARPVAKPAPKPAPKAAPKPAPRAVSKSAPVKATAAKPAPKPAPKAATPPAAKRPAATAAKPVAKATKPAAPKVEAVKAPAGKAVVTKPLVKPLAAKPPAAKLPAAKVAPAAAPASKPTPPKKVVLDKFMLEQRDLLQEQLASHLSQAQALKEEADALAREMEPGESEFGEEGGEGGTLSVERELDLVLSAQAKAAVDEIERALHKIEAGTYGICEKCGKEIPRARLKALPHAPLCVACKSGGLSRR